MKKDRERCHQCGHVKKKHSPDLERCLVRNCRCKGFKEKNEKTGKRAGGKEGRNDKEISSAP